ncbi:UNVERIFIED_CONTAM: hypothetical protein GTU68_043740 [Idotea baltica]|nr:hypothetical protein [Idotea baltica]
MPWNFPFWQVFRLVIPTLFAGNTVLIKHAPNVPQCGQFIEQLFSDAQFPKGLYQNIRIDESGIKNLIKDNRIMAVSLTGSVTAGSKVASIAGEAIKKTVLELGGSDPFIILKDANLKLAAEMAVQSRMLNAGQSCIAAKRWIVDQAVADDFMLIAKQAIEQLKVGDPQLLETDIGPLARPDILSQLEHQISQSIKMGAIIKCGGSRAQSEGNFFNPTLLINVNSKMPVFQEEVFGPVASIIIAENTQHAIELANESDFGLGAAVWTEDPDKALRVARQIQCGTIAINGMVASRPEMPFGGIKNSGFGRELSAHGLLEFVNIKSIAIS